MTKGTAPFRKEFWYGAQTIPQAITITCGKVYTGGEPVTLSKD